MVTEDISKFIKDIRKKNNLTQKDLADKLGVTYQAVSKWENGKNIPDIETLKQISKIFNVDINDIIGTNANTKKNTKIIIIAVVALILAVLLMILIITKNINTFKQISTTCEDFKVNGSVAYNKKTSSLYISKVEFCGKNDEEYKSLECNLFEEYNNVKVKISSYKKIKNISLKEYLKDVSLNVNNYSSVCKKFNNSKLHIEIDAVSNDDKITTYKIPIKLVDNSCNK